MAGRRPSPVSHRNEQNAAVSLPPGTPPWVTGELIRQTIEVWQPRYREPLSVEDAVEILLGASRLLRTIVDEAAEEPASAEVEQSAQRTTKPK